MLLHVCVCHVVPVNVFFEDACPVSPNPPFAAFDDFGCKSDVSLPSPPARVGKIEKFNSGAAMRGQRI
jgi:hypothetical protein